MSNESTVNIFERAARLKLRFETPRGFITMEDLWDLPLAARPGHVSLDDVARALNQKLKEGVIESFVTKTTKVNEEYQLAFDLVRHVIDVRLAEREATEARLAKREQKQKLLELIAKKQDANLGEKSVEELQAMVEAL